ncbi:peptidylglycine alpha-hydroxylating monooxygenase-like [Saccoglossus kowalevskii]
MGLGVCGPDSPEFILYAWGANSPELSLPASLGFKVGGNSGINYLVLQVHYGLVDRYLDEALKDTSGLTLKMTIKKPTYLAGVSLLSGGSSAIPPRMRKWHIDADCLYNGQAVLHPFAFRVHTNNLGTVVSGYRVRNGVFTLIGKEDPQKPQAFYPVVNNVDIRQGDMLALRCTYNTMTEDTVTYIGATLEDEMCNFYIMYYVNDQTELSGKCDNVDSNSLNFPVDV